MVNKYDTTFKKVPKNSNHYELINGKNKELTSLDIENNVYAGNFIRNIMEDNNYLQKVKESKSNKGEDYITLGVGVDTTGRKPLHLKIDADEMLHTSHYGATGSAKTTTMINAMVQLAYRNYGFTFIDPKEGVHDDAPNDKDFPRIGEDSLKLLRRIPKHRLKDVIYINPVPVKKSKNEEYSISLNPIQVPPTVEEKSGEYEREDIISSQKDLLKSIMMATGSGDGDMFGPLMERNYEALFQAMIRSNRKFTFADLHMILTNPELIEVLEKNISNELQDEYISEEVKQLEDTNKEELESLIRRTQRLVTKNRTTRDFIVNKDTDVDFYDAISSNKIIIVDIQSKQDAVVNTAAGYVINSLFAAAKKAQLKKEHILFGDEFHKIIKMKEYLPLKDILSEGRSNKFLLWFATQYPSRIRQFAKESRTNIGTTIAGNLNESEAQIINDSFINQDHEKLNALNISTLKNYEFFLSTQYEDGFAEVKGHPPYPPLRSINKAAITAIKSVEKHGSKHKRKYTYDDVVNPIFVDNPKTLMDEQGLKAVQTAQIYDTYHNNTQEKNYATYETIEKIIETAYNVDKEQFNIESWLEKQANIDNIKTEDTGTEVLYKLTNEGKKIASTDTGQSGSAGKSQHRMMIQKLRKQLAENGIHIITPRQDDGDGKMADAHGYVFNIHDETPLTNKYSIGDEIIFEIEKETTASKSYLMMNNFTKTDENVVFVSNTSKIVEKIERILQKQQGKAKQSTKYGDRLYNTNEYLICDKKYYVAIKGKPNRSKWYIDEETNNIILKHKSFGTVNISLNEFKNISIDKFPIKIKKTSKGYIVKDKLNNTETKPYKSLRQIKKQTEYNPVKKPWVPHLEFDEYPINRNKYDIIALENKNENRFENKIYYKGEYYDFDEYNRKHSNTDTDTNKNKNKNTTTSQNKEKQINNEETKNTEKDYDSIFDNDFEL